VSDDDQLADELASLRIPRDSSTGERTRRSSRGGLVVALVAIVLLGVGGFYLYSEGRGRVFSTDVELGAISLMSPLKSEVTLVATGYVYTRKQATVAPKTTGRLARLLVSEGNHVKAGQLIAELESGDAEAQLAQVRADIAASRAKVDRARADLADAELKLTRQKALVTRGAGTESAFDDARSLVAQDQAELEAAQADVRAVEARQQAAEVQLENTKVRAPFDGTVVRKLAEVGEVLGPASPGIVTISDLSDLEVQADVSEAQFAKVKVGTPAEILLDAFPDRRFRGQVSEIRQTVDRAKAAVTVKVRFTDDATGVLPDMAAKVSFLAKALDAEALKAAPKVVAPADAIVERGGEKVVFTDDNGHARAVPVATGGQVGDLIELTHGPSPGTRVIRHPDAELKSGAAIKEKQE
jgi:RND family efflux transporter MFP subunit